MTKQLKTLTKHLRTVRPLARPKAPATLAAHLDLSVRQQTRVL